MKRVQVSAATAVALALVLLLVPGFIAMVSCDGRSPDQPDERQRVGLGAANGAPGCDPASSDSCEPGGTAASQAGAQQATSVSTPGMLGTATPSPMTASTLMATVRASPTTTGSPTRALATPPGATPVRPQPSDTAGKPATLPAPSNTRKPTAMASPRPTATPVPTVAEWTWTERLVSVGEDGQYCGEGDLRIRVIALDPYDNQVTGVWVYDRYSRLYQVTGNVDAPDWGPGETMFNYGGDGGGALCIADGLGGGCLTEYTRDMPCFNPPPFEDMWAAGWCQCCGTEAEGDKELCRQMHERGDRCMNWGHYAWRVVYRRSW